MSQTTKTSSVRASAAARNTCRMLICRFEVSEFYTIGNEVREAYSSNARALSAFDTCTRCNSENPQARVVTCDHGCMGCNDCPTMLENESYHVKILKDANNKTLSTHCTTRGCKGVPLNKPVVIPAFDRLRNDCNQKHNDMYVALQKDHQRLAANENGDSTKADRILRAKESLPPNKSTTTPTDETGAEATIVTQTECETVSNDKVTFEIEDLIREITRPEDDDIPISNARIAQPPLNVSVPPPNALSFESVFESEACSAIPAPSLENETMMPQKPSAKRGRKPLPPKTDPSYNTEVLAQEERRIKREGAKRRKVIKLEQQQKSDLFDRLVPKLSAFLASQGYTEDVLEHMLA